MRSLLFLKHIINLEQFEQGSLSAAPCRYEIQPKGVLMKSLTVLCLVLLSSGPVLSADYMCRAHRGREVYSSFCEGLDLQSCGFHKNFCRIVYYRSYEGACVPQPGREAHESFCDGLDAYSCNFHRSFCRWLD